MAVITANTGSNNWNTNGAWVGSVQPGTGDDVIIPATAVVTIPAATTVLGRSLTVAASGTIAFAATTSTLALGDATAGAGNVALSISATATVTLTGIGVINFLSTSATTQTITTGGKTLPTYTINGTGSSYQLADANTSTGSVTHIRGTFDTNGQTCAWVSLVSNSGTTRTLTLGASNITVSATGAGWTLTTTALTFNPNTSTIIVSANATFAGGGATYNNLTFTSPNGANPGVTGANTFNNLTVTGTAVKTGSFFVGATQTITGTLNVTGQSAVNRIIFQSQTAGTPMTINCSSAPTLSNVDFQDITAAGAGGTWTGTSMGDAQGNSNITTDTPVTQTRTGAGGNWSTAANWTSRVPLPQDNVIISSGASGSVSGDMPRGGKSLDFTGFTGAWANTITVNYYGSLTLSTGMSVSNSTCQLAGRGAQTITSSGKTMGQNMIINAVTGSYTLQDSISIATASNLTISSGTFSANGFNVSTGGFVANAGTVNMGSGTWSVITTAALGWTVAAGVTLNASTSTIVFTGASTSTRTFAGGGKTYNILTYTVAGSTGQLNITGANTFNTINFSDVTNARSLLFTAATTTTITSAFNVSGTSGKLMTIGSITAAQHTIAMPAGISRDFLSISQSKLTGNSAYAGANSVDGGSNSTAPGWIFSAPPTNSTALLMGVG